MKEFIEKLITRIMLESASCKVYKLINPNMEDIAEFNAYKKCIEIVKELAGEYNNDWISCSERLPEYSDCYNVTVGVSNEMGYYECVKAFNYVKKQGEEGKWVVPKDLFSTYSVIAWQNTPAPYKEGE